VQASLSSRPLSQPLRFETTPSGSPEAPEAPETPETPETTEAPEVPEEGGVQEEAEYSGEERFVMTGEMQIQDGKMQIQDGKMQIQDGKMQIQDGKMQIQSASLSGLEQFNTSHIILHVSKLVIQG